MAVRSAPGPRRSLGSAACRNRTKFEHLDQLTDLAAEAGLPLTHMAHARAGEHPAVSSVIIGPRTPAQLDDAGAGLGERAPDEDLLDAIDAVVALKNIDTVDTTLFEPQLGRAIAAGPAEREVR
ncbi:MAG: hypothetical protein R2695_08715 [Acidimicrobiales bacterium]